MVAEKMTRHAMMNLNDCDLWSKYEAYMCMSVNNK